MKLEGTLDAFSLPDIFQLLSYTKKTGTLHLRREAQHGVVHLRDGAVTGGRSNVVRQALGRRLVGAGLVDDEALADAAEKVLDTPGAGLGRALAEGGTLDPEALSRVASECVTDAVFELLRWPDGAFAFVMDEADPDDVGLSLPVEDVVAEATRRQQAWATVSQQVPSPVAVVALAPAPAEDVRLSRDEWSLLALVDGRRTVADLVALSGTGEFVVVSALAGLVDRGLVVVGASAGADATAQRQQLLAALEGSPVAEPAAEAVAEPAAPSAPSAPAASVPAPSTERKPVIPERPEPFTPERRPAYAEEPSPAMARFTAGASSAASSAPTAAAPAAPTAGPTATPTSVVGAVQGAHALQPEAAPAPSPHIDRDPSVNKSLLLRLIAGVRGL